MNLQFKFVYVPQTELKILHLMYKQDGITVVLQTVAFSSAMEEDVGDLLLKNLWISLPILSIMALQ